ncbi:excinuclease ABC subunit A [Roseovarius sp.]|uniref:excinuclease ABC subunit A n=1 Tax=Roseovarius sp. TaxID=1486281 RepID=UPI003A97EC08
MKRILTLFVMGIALGGSPAFAGGNDCPPGLAKKHNGCQPPGQAKKHGYYRIGDRIGDDYIILRNPERYGLDRNETYYRVGDQVYRVNRETREILDLIGAAAAVLN